MTNKATVLAVVNQKGGTGKTTTCENLGVGLAQEGKKVLLVDVDPQGSLTISLGYPRPDDLDTTLSELMAKVIQETPLSSGEGILHHEEGVDLIPANISLSGMEVSLVNAMSRETILKQLIEPMKRQYDFILLDCMPSLGMLTVNALAAADNVLIPMQAQYLSAKGLEQLLQTVKSILISCGARLAPFDIQAVREMMEYDELELEKLGEEKIALFAVVSDSDPTFNFISAMMYSQMFNVLCNRALTVYHGRLPVHVTCLFDEFANQKIPNWEHLVSVIRSRNISAHIVLQTYSQLTIAIFRIFLKSILLAANGRKNPIGINIRKFPASIVLTQLPRVNSPDIILKTMGVKLKVPSNNSISLPLYPTKILAQIPDQKFLGTRIKFANPVR